MYSELKPFFEENPLAVRAAHSIRDGHEITLNVRRIDGSLLAFTFAKQGGRNVLREGRSESPDLTFTMAEAAARSLVTGHYETVGQVGLHIFEKMLSNNPEDKIRAAINAGFLRLMTGGYLGVLTAGGGDVAKFLATRGLGNVGKLKDAINRLRKGSEE